MLIIRVFNFVRRHLGLISNLELTLNSNVTIGGRLKINGYLLNRMEGRVSIGNNVLINSGYWLNPVGGNIISSFTVKRDAELIIGQNVAISNLSLNCHSRIEIGDGVCIGGGCSIYDTDFHSLNPRTRLQPFISQVRDTDIRTAPVRLGSNSWIGAQTIILKGVTVGENSIIGAGSVVSRNIPDNEVWGGNPIRKIKDLVVA